MNLTNDPRYPTPRLDNYVLAAAKLLSVQNRHTDNVYRQLGQTQGLLELILDELAPMHGPWRNEVEG